ncbi:MAG TPA: TauD/TfdA family dioxygenase [Dongiaceae bacterium]
MNLTLPAETKRTLKLAAAVPTGEDAVQLTWSDGTATVMANRVLRYACSCALCGDTDRGLRIAKLPDLPQRPKIARLGLDAAGNLAIAWADGHETVLDPARLHAERPGFSTGRHASRSLWNAESASRLIPEIAVDDALAPDDRGLFRALQALRDVGLVILRGGAPTAEETERVTARFGSVRETDYGRFFELKSEPDPQVAGATSRAQTPHTDEPFRYAPPGIFFLHCLEAGADKEGASIFVDGFAAAERLRQESPESFRLLSTQPMNFHRRHAGTVDLRCRARVFSLDDDGEVVGVRYNDRATGAFDQALDGVDAMMDAAAEFMRIVYDPAMTLTVMLQPGDVAICDNHRAMHGRRAFDPNRKFRHLRSCHIDRDQVHSRLRVLATEFAPEEAGLALPAGASV